MGFLRSAHEGSFTKAAKYIQFAPELGEKERVELARELLFVLDRGFVGNLDAINMQPEGNAEDGMTLDRDTVGAVVGAEQSSPVVMVRVSEGGQQIWLLSRETVEMVPQQFTEFGFPAVERMLPRALIDHHFWSMPLWVLLGVLVALPMALGLAWLMVFAIVRWLPKRWEVSRRPNLPAAVFVGLVLHNFASRLLGLPLVYRVWYSRILFVLWLTLWVWVIFSLIGYADRRIREYLERNQLSSTQSILQLGRRLLQMLVLVGAALIGLKSFGYDITAALAGLGIGGIAIAFAAQKTLENVFGGLSLLSDQSIRVGDSCQFGATTASVEDIGLRATRFRTMQRSVLYIPNGQLATMNIENLGQRDRILFKHVIGVKYGMGSGGMKGLLNELRDLLEKDVRVSEEGRRVQFLKFGTYSLEIELFCYVLTNDYAEFLKIQEELLLIVMEIVKRHDSDFAFPSQTLYVERGTLDLGGVPGLSIEAQKPQE
jgi:MscS family membrane protein